MGEFCAFDDYDDHEALRRLRAALEAAFLGWPEAVRDALDPNGHIQVDVNDAWDADTALKRIPILDKAAGGLQYVEQPCWTIEELAQVRRKVNVPITADESIRRADDPLKVAVAGAADVISSAVETSVGMGAQVALAAAIPELPYACGFGTGALLTGDLVPAERDLNPRGGAIVVPAGPLSPAPALLTRWAMADPDRVQWRAGRLDRVLALHNAAANGEAERAP